MLQGGANLADRHLCVTATLLVMSASVGRWGDVPHARQRRPRQSGRRKSKARRATWMGQRVRCAASWASRRHRPESRPVGPLSASAESYVGQIRNLIFDSGQEGYNHRLNGRIDMRDLAKQIEIRRKEITSERLSMSIGELAGLYRRAELDIHPKFQRILRWKDYQKTRLIESLLLRIPIPSLFVAQDPDGSWDVVDGVQRLGTIFQFIGILKKPDGELQTPLVLRGTHLLPGLEGYTFNSDAGPRHFSQSQQLDFQRLRLDLQIILKESEASTKYELFERLNTGGSNASEQEVRNCVLVWMNEQRYDWMTDHLAEDANFTETVILPDRAEDEQFRLELVLRFLCLHTMRDPELKKIRDLGEFLNEQNREFAQDDDYDEKKHEAIFRDTFERINEAAGSNAFRKYDAERGFRGGFLISAFEAVALGVAFNAKRWSTNGSSKKLAKLIETMWNQKDFIQHIGTGVPAKTRIQHSIPFGRQYFRP
jgi:hypothetical protein